MDDTEIKYFVEAALMAAGRPLTIDQLQGLFDGRSTPDKPRIRQAIASLVEDYEGRGITVAEVASGFRMQIRSDMVQRLQKLWEERPPRYSRALFETLALIAYRQPMTRGEIEEIRGVSVSPNIIRSLLEREWVRVVGHRDVPGRPAMFGTTRQFLDYFGLKKLDDLPPLADIQDWESLRIQLNLPAVEEEPGAEDGLELAAAVVSELPLSGAQERVADEDHVDVPEESLAANPEPDSATSEWLPDVQVSDVSDTSEPELPDADALETVSLEPSSDPDAGHPDSRLEDTNLEPIEATAWPDPLPAIGSAGNDENPEQSENDKEVKKSGG